MSAPALPPVATTWLPELNESRDGKREAYKLINQLRRRVMGGSSAGGLSLFSTVIGRGDALSTKTDGVELIGLAFFTPYVYPSFTCAFSGRAEDTASDGIFRIRAGGTFGLTDGTEIGRITATTTSFAAYESVPQLVNANTANLFQFTLQSSVGNTARWQGGALAFS